MEEQNENQEKIHSEKFQRSIIKYFCEDIIFANTFGVSMTSDVFSTRYLSMIFKLAKASFLKYQHEVSEDQLQIELTTLATMKDFPEDLYVELRDEIQDIFALNIEGKEQFIKDKITEFYELKNAKIGLVKATEKLNKGDVDGFYKVFDETRSHTLGGKDGLEFKHLFSLLPKWCESSKAVNKVSFGYPTLDAITAGGMGKGELHVVIGSTNAGKTTLGINIGAANILRGKVVFHASFETDEEIVHKKYGVRLTGLTYEELTNLENKKIYEDKLVKLGRELPLFVASWPPNTEKVSIIRSWITRKRSQTGITPDLIIVDYDDCLIPSTGKTGDLHQDGGTLYTDLLGLAKHFQCAILVFAQADTEGMRKSEAGKILYKSDIAGSRRKTKDADSVITINFKAPDDLDGYLYADKVRNGRNKVRLDVVRDLDRCLVLEKTKMDQK